MSRHDSNVALAAEAWRRLFGFLMSTRPQRDRVLDRLGLTPNDAKALWSLDAQQGRTMSSLAAEWLCDASNATWMVDRLEHRGLAERRTNPADRRVKLVILTPRGAETKAELDRGMNEPPPELLALGRADLEALLAAVSRLPVGGSRAPSDDRLRPAAVAAQREVLPPAPRRRGTRGPTST